LYTTDILLPSTCGHVSEQLPERVLFVYRKLLRLFSHKVIEVELVIAVFPDISHIESRYL
jgi:hypothetical protein